MRDEWKVGWSKATSKRRPVTDNYDERFRWGQNCLAVGLLLWVVGAVCVFLVTRSSGENSFDEAVSAVERSSLGRGDLRLRLVRDAVRRDLHGRGGADRPMTKPLSPPAKMRRGER